jgi:hypothetical protein
MSSSRPDFPGIYASAASAAVRGKDVDDRDKPGHDDDVNHMSESEHQIPLRQPSRATQLSCVRGSAAPLVAADLHQQAQGLAAAGQA